MEVCHDEHQQTLRNCSGCMCGCCSSSHGQTQAHPTTCIGHVTHTQLSVVHLHAACALQVLKLPAWDRSGATAAALTGLQHLPQLSYLVISNSQFKLHESVVDPVLSKLAVLQHLELQYVRLLPSLLVPLTQLQHLRIWHDGPFGIDSTGAGRCRGISHGAHTLIAGMYFFVT